MHDNQLDLPTDVARALIGRQFPQWRSLPVRAVAAAGTDNAIFRIGDRYAARFPLKAGDAETVRRRCGRRRESCRAATPRTS